MMSRLFSYLLAACLLCSAAPLFGDDGKETAKAKIEEGKRLIKEENYAGALGAFEVSYAISPKPWILFNIAMCQKALHRYAEAIETFNRYLNLEKKNEKSNFKTLDLALKSLDELEQLVGKVILVDAPEGAEVSVDDALAGTTPLTGPLILDPGRHALRISKPGFQKLEIDVIVNSGAEVEVRAALEQPRADIKVECRGDDTTVSLDDTMVFIDGTAAGPCPYSGEVDSGEHHIKVTSPDRVPFESTIDAASGSTIVIAVDLKPDALLAPPSFVVTPPKGQEEPASPRWMRTTGIAAGTVGAVSVIVAGVLTSQWYKQFDVVESAADAADEENYPGNDDNWILQNNAWKMERDKSNHIKAGLISCYAIGGGLIAAGATFFVMDFLKQRKESPIAVTPTPTGLSVRF